MVYSSPFHYSSSLLSTLEHPSMSISSSARTLPDISSLFSSATCFRVCSLRCELGPGADDAYRYGIDCKCEMDQSYGCRSWQCLYSAGYEEHSQPVKSLKLFPGVLKQASDIGTAFWTLVRHLYNWIPPQTLYSHPESRLSQYTHFVSYFWNWSFGHLCFGLPLSGGGLQ
jgi:hypothetical protein